MSTPDLMSHILRLNLNTVSQVGPRSLGAQLQLCYSETQTFQYLHAVRRFAQCDSLSHKKKSS